MQKPTSEIELNGEWKGLILPIARIDVELPWGWLRRGWHDFCRAKEISLVFGALIAIASFIILYLMWQTDFFPYAWPLAAGFMFVAPMLGVCFYDISRRLELGDKISFHSAATAWRRNPGSIFTMGLVMMLIQVAWIYLAILIYAIFFGDELANWHDFIIRIFFSDVSLPFLVVGTIVGGALAVTSFAISVVSFPMLLDRDVSVPQAIATSVAATIVNWRVLFGWAALIALFNAAGIVTACLGLVVTMPLLGHASWHAYRDLVAAR